MKMTLLEANRLVETCDGLFHRAAKALERGSNSGQTDYINRCNKQADACRDRAEKMLAPLGITVDYPGLYPSFSVGGFDHHTTESAVSAALVIQEEKR